MTCCPNCGSEIAWSQNVGLTLQQRKLLTFIREYMAENKGIAPSFDDMARALGLVSKSGIHRLILALEERGKIARLENRARCIAVLA